MGRTEVRTEVLSKLFKAKYAGTCAADEACESAGIINVGDVVQYVVGDLYHEACVTYALGPDLVDPRRRDESKFQGYTLEEMGF